MAATIISSVFAAWKNNDFTLFAKISGAFLKALKDGKITADEAKELVAEISDKDGGSEEETESKEDKTE